MPTAGALRFFYTNRLHRAEVVPMIAAPRGLHRQACIIVIFKRHRHMVTLESTPTSTSTHFPNIVQVPTRRSHSPTCLFPMKQPISCRAPTRRRQDTMSDADEADTTRPGTDEAKAAHLSELTRPDIFIIGHRQARGIRQRIAGATDVPLRLSISPHHHHRLHRAIGEDST